MGRGALARVLAGSSAAAWVALVSAAPVATTRDFSGVWNYATMTPLERPREFADARALTAEEADAYERRTIERQANTNNTAGPDWWDPGTRHSRTGARR